LFNVRFLSASPKTASPRNSSNTTGPQQQKNESRVPKWTLTQVTETVEKYPLQDRHSAQQQHKERGRNRWYTITGDMSIVISLDWGNILFCFTLVLKA
jgi:hypothetical protein